VLRFESGHKKTLPVNLGRRFVLGRKRVAVIVFISLLSFLLAPLQLTASELKAPVVEWEIVFGKMQFGSYDSGYSDYGIDIRETDDGGFLLLYKTQPVYDWRVFLENRGRIDADPDFYFTKFDRSGCKQWEKRLNTRDRLSAVWFTGDGGCIGLTANAEDDYGQTTNVKLIKFDFNGKKVWEKQYMDKKSFKISSIEQTSDGGFVVVGGSGSTSDVYLARLDAASKMLWSKTFGGSRQSDYGVDVHETKDKGFIVCGTTGSFPGYENVYLVKTNASGKKIWEKAFGGKNHDYGISVQQTKDGGFILLGNTRPFGEGSSIYLIKTDSCGEKSWEKTFSGK